MTSYVHQALDSTKPGAFRRNSVGYQLHPKPQYARNQCFVMNSCAILFLFQALESKETGARRSCIVSLHSAMLNSNVRSKRLFSIHQSRFLVWNVFNSIPAGLVKRLPNPTNIPECKYVYIKTVWLANTKEAKGKRIY